MSDALAERARRLRELHEAPGLLVLPNAWDAASARALAGLGHPALATTSSGVSAALGYADGERTPPAAMLAAVAAIASAVDVPVTADLEAGYGLEPAALVEGLLAAGAVGLNLEDSDHASPDRRLVDAGRHADRLAAVKGAGRAAGVDLVLNARVDVHLRGLELEAGLERARRYAAAGADVVYPIAAPAATLARWVAEAGAPVNALLVDDGPSPAELAELGVRRATFGGGLFDRALAAAVSHPWAADTRRYSPASPLQGS